MVRALQIGVSDRCQSPSHHVFHTLPLLITGATGQSIAGDVSGSADAGAGHVLLNLRPLRRCELQLRRVQICGVLLRVRVVAVPGVNDGVVEVLEHGPRFLVTGSAADAKVGDQATRLHSV